MLANYVRLSFLVECPILYLAFFKTTGCPRNSFLYFISLYFSTIGLGNEIRCAKNQT